MNHDQQLFAHLDYIEEQQEREESILSQFYHRNHIKRIWAIRKALPEYTYTLRDIVEMIIELWTEYTIQTLEEAYLNYRQYA